MSTVNVCIVSLIVLVLFCYGAFASKITMKATPSIINPGFTQSLTLRCTVIDNSTNNDPIIGRRNVQFPELRSAAEADISHITSIIITRTDHVTGINETVATVTTFDPATAHLDLEKLRVNGTTDSKNSGEKGYLELTWRYPTAHQYGVYTCEVFALNNVDHPEEVSETVQIGINEPTTQELLLYIADLDKRTSVLEQQVKDIGGANVQTGILDCVQGTHDYPVVFANAFTKIPTTITAVAGSQTQASFVLKPAVINLTSAGFTLRCTSHQTTSILWVAL